MTQFGRFSKTTTYVTKPLFPTKETLCHLCIEMYVVSQQKLILGKKMLSSTAGNHSMPNARMLQAQFFIILRNFCFDVIGYGHA